MRSFFQRLFYGRYGSDALNNAILVVCLVLLVAARAVRAGWLDLLVLVLLGVCYFRVFSRNIQARYRENQKFLALTQPVRRWFTTQRQRFRDRKTHRYYHCPSCGMLLRVPKGRGKISISCPKCRTQFVKKT